MTCNNLKIEKVKDEIWVVVKTKARSEKKFAEYCLKQGITHYLPLRRSIKRYPSRIVQFMIPMFSGYVFAQINPNNKLLLLRGNHSAQVIFPDLRMEEKLIQELNEIRTLIEATQERNIEVRPEIQIGKKVCIKTGVLSGLNGIVTRRKNKMRIAVNVEMVGHSVSLDLDVGEVDIDF